MIPIIDEAALRGIVARVRAAGTDSGRCEVKSCAGGVTKDVARTLGAFSNGCGGVLVCGLDERKRFAPASGFDASRVQDAIARICAEELTPPIRPVMDILALDGAPVLVVSVEELQPKDKPCYITRQGRYSGSFIRTGDGDRRLSAYEVDRLMEERVQPRHDRALVPEATLGDLDEDLVLRVVARERAVHPRFFGQLSREEALEKLGIVGRDDAGELHPTLAGLVALGTYPQEFFPRLVIAFTSYYTPRRGEPAPGGRRFLDAHTCVGPAPAMVEEAISAVIRNTRTGARIEGAFRYDVPDYPVEAIREALVNAVMHRDYSREAQGTAIHLDLFPDRMEISNSGGLFGTVTIESLGGPCEGSCRNERLAAILESTPAEQGGYLAENRGSGYRAMRDACARAGLAEPLPVDGISRFSLTLFGPEGVRPGDGLMRGAECSAVNPAHPMGRSVVRMSGSFDIETAFGRTEREIMETVREQGEAGTAELVEKIGRSRPTVLKALRNLLAHGLLVPTSTVKNDPHLRYRAL